VGGQDVFASSFALTYTSNLPDGSCSAGGNGSADGAGSS